ncbi:MAG: peptidoglycan glycosyltransferase [Geminicoccaceae bacterium]|nr:peptidoglycan glycosyltransferase [Geminicoccaceae bacterium]
MHREGDRLRAFTRRALLLGAGQLGLFGVLAGRLYYLQVVSADEYALLADENRINHRLLPPARGRIFDRHGVTLARNIPTYRVLVVREQTADMRATLDALARLIPLPEESIREVLAEVGRRRRFVPILVREGLNWTEVSRIAIHAPELPGVALDAGLLRNYPTGPVMAHVLGYVAPVAERELTGDPLLELPEFRTGKNGIEKVYEERLRGRAGLSRFEVNALGREIKELYRHDGEPGQDLTLTIDLDLQRYTHQRLSAEESASAVVLDVHSGDVLALVSVPTFDPAGFTNGLSREVWRELTTNPRAPLVNKAIGGQYPPGSTFKMIVALAALEAGIGGPDHEVYCPGHMQLGQHRFHCWKRWGHGTLRLVDALAQSCDVYFYDLARRVGVDAIATMARRFGLGSTLEIDLPGERPGLVPDRAWKQANRGVPWQLGETLIVGIGQGYMQATPLQLAIMTARIANGGRAVRPRLVREPPGPGGTPAPEPVPAVGVSDWSFRFVREGMFKVVNGDRGTARQAALANPELALAGKTGTSQVRRISRAERATGVRKNEDKLWEERDHALFVAFAPYREPRYALAVVVEHGGSGSQAAAPLARDIMAKALELAPTRSRPPLTAEREPAPRAPGDPA